MPFLHKRSKSLLKIYLQWPSPHFSSNISFASIKWRSFSASKILLLVAFLPFFSRHIFNTFCACNLKSLVLAVLSAFSTSLSSIPSSENSLRRSLCSSWVLSVISDISLSVTFSIPVSQSDISLYEYSAYILIVQFSGRKFHSLQRSEKGHQPSDPYIEWGGKCSGRGEE